MLRPFDALNLNYSARMQIKLHPRCFYIDEEKMKTEKYLFHGLLMKKLLGAAESAFLILIIEGIFHVIFD